MIEKRSRVEKSGSCPCIGIMQGRLSPSVGEKIQAFPAQTWRNEFACAREANLDCIEWIYEAGTENSNPLHTGAGIREIRSLIDKSGVGVWSICADYFMVNQLVTEDGHVHESAVEDLCWLLERAAQLEIIYVVLPFVDQSSLRSGQQIVGLLQVMEAVIPSAESAQVELHLETDLQPIILLDVLRRISHPLVKANYDIGNSASLGHDPADELLLIGSLLGSVHVKDRILGGSTVPLGTGSADFSTCFRMIAQTSFKGPFILQAAREDGISEIELARKNREFVKTYFGQC